MRRRPWLEAGPPFQECRPPGGEPLLASANELWGGRGGGAVTPSILQRKVSPGPRAVAHVAPCWWPLSLRSIPARTSVGSAWDPQQRDVSARPPSENVLAFRTRAYLLPATSSEAKVTSVFGVWASPESPRLPQPWTAARSLPTPDGRETCPAAVVGPGDLGEQMLSNVVGMGEAAGGRQGWPWKPAERRALGAAGADMRGALCNGRPGPLAASSPLEYPDLVDGRQGGRHVGLEVPVVHPGLAESPRRGVVLPVVVPIPFAVRPEAVQVHLQGEAQVRGRWRGGGRRLRGRGPQASPWVCRPVSELWKPSSALLDPPGTWRPTARSAKVQPDAGRHGGRPRRALAPGCRAASAAGATSSQGSRSQGPGGVESGPHPAPRKHPASFTGLSFLIWKTGQVVRADSFLP